MKNYKNIFDVAWVIKSWIYVDDLILAFDPIDIENTFEIFNLMPEECNLQKTLKRYQNNQKRKRNWNSFTPEERLDTKRD